MGFTGTKEAESADTYAVVETASPETGTIELFTTLIGTVEPEQMERIYPEAWGHSGEMMQGLAIVNIGGLIASTVLSLLMLPVYYGMMRKKNR